MSKPLNLILKEKVIGDVLFENKEGTLGNITLSNTIANYERIEIEYKTKDGSLNVKTVNINKKQNAITGLIDGYMTWIKIRTIEIEGKNLINLQSFQYEFTTNAIENDDKIAITKVIGYKT